MKKILLTGAMLASFGLSFGQVALNENFEGTTFPPTGWTVERTISDPDYTWFAATGDNAISGNQSAAVAYNSDEDSDESLISPSFSLAGYTTAYFNFTASLGYDWMVAPDNNGDLFAKISTDGGATWTQVWVEEDEGEFENYAPLLKRIDISDYAGETNVKIKFQYVAFDADLARIDDVSITACAPINGLTLDDLSSTSASFTIDGTSTGYSVEYGVTGFTLGSGTTINTTQPQFLLDGLTEGTGYSFYITATCGGTANSGWEGPYSFYTPLISATSVPYAYGFENTPLAAGGWYTELVNEEGAAWGRYMGGTDFPAQEGTYFAAAIGTAADGDSWLFSRGLRLVGGTDISYSYFVKEIALDTAGNGNENYLTVTIGSDKTSDAQTITLVPQEEITDEEYVQKTGSYTVPADGVYYIGFHYEGPANTAAANGALILDGFNVTGTTGVNEQVASTISVFPNPAVSVVNVANTNGALINNIKVADLNGRTVKNNKFDGLTDVQVNISDLASGVYMMTISSDKGTTTKKIVKH